MPPLKKAEARTVTRRAPSTIRMACSTARSSQVGQASVSLRSRGTARLAVFSRAVRSVRGADTSAFWAGERVCQSGNPRRRSRASS